MTRSLIIKLFWGSIIGLVAGLVLMGVTTALAISNDIFVMSGPDVTGIRSGVLSWALLGLMALAVFVLLFAAAAHFVAWIGAVLKTQSGSSLVGSTVPPAHKVPQRRGVLHQPLS